MRITLFDGWRDDSERYFVVEGHRSARRRYDEALALKYFPADL